MLFLSGICFVLAILSFVTKSMPKKRRQILIQMEVFAGLLLIMDRFAYLYRGDVTTLGWWMVRISNFCVFLFSLYLVHCFNIYLIDLFKTEGNLQKVPKRLIAIEILFLIALILLIIAQFTGWYYSFDEQNRYQRAPLFIICYSLPFLCLVLQLSVILQYFTRFSRVIGIPLLLFDVVPIIATFIQLFVYGLSLTNITMVGEVIVLYIFVIIDMNNTVESAREREVEFLKEEQKNMHTMFEQTAEALANAIDAKDAYTHGHSARVAEYSKQIAILAGKSEKECEEVYFAGLLHDVGKIGISEAIINKAGKLTNEEYAEIKKHPVIGNQILSSISKSPYLSIGAHYHHERYDGRGYPEGLKGNDIPDIARIIAVADAYDAMTSKRSYRETIPQQKVREEIVKGMETQFDPNYAKYMLHLIDLDTEYKMKEHDEIKELAGKNEMHCDKIRSNISEGLLLSDSITHIHLNCKADEDNLSMDSIPSFILFDSLDARVHDDRDTQNDMLYLEYATLRFDGQTNCVTARDIKNNVIKNYKEEPNWLEEYKNGIDYDIDVLRQKDHVLLNIKNKFQKIQTIIALQYTSRYAYLAFTGQYCNISDVELQKSEDVAPANYIPRIAEELNYIDGPEGDIPSIQVDGWRSAATIGVPVTDGMKITFHSKSLPTARLVWHCPFITLFYSDDQKVNGLNFREFVLIRIDGENWESYQYAQNTILINKNDDFNGWDEWKRLNKEGIDCKIYVRREENKLTVVTENAGISIKSITQLKEETPEVYLALTGDQCAISNIRISR